MINKHQLNWRLIGGLDEARLCPVAYRTDIQEMKAREDLPCNRVILDEFGYSSDLLLHAIQSELKETGVYIAKSILNFYSSFLSANIRSFKTLYSTAQN